MEDFASAMLAVNQVVPVNVVVVVGGSSQLDVGAMR